MLSRDFTGGLAAIIIGGVYLYYTAQIRTSSLADNIGPAGIPTALGVLMIILGLILCAQALARSLTAKPIQPEWTGEGKRIWRAAVMLLLGIAYLAVVETLGYIVSMTLLIVLTALYLGTPLSWRVPIIAGGGALTLWALFVQLLGINMPSGIF
jgi:hypothetical protein